ncbi:MAG: tetratricopeptide repeat protein [Planctomycetes bacterium]|nr:tetratricopeptide repeat protein [Planctomycetota bacterium]
MEFHDPEVRRLRDVGARCTAEGRHELALEAFQQGVTVARKRAPDLVAAMTVNLCGALRRCNRVEEALRRLGPLFREDDTPARVLLVAYFEEAALLADYELTEAALNSLLEAEKLLPKISQQGFELAAGLETMFGVVASDLGFHEKARAHFESALNAYERVDDPGHASLALKNIGATCEEMGQMDEAEVFFRRSLDLAKKHQNLERAAIAATDLALFLLRRARPSDAEESAHEATLLADRHGDPEIRTEAWKAMREIARRRGNPLGAEACDRRLAEIERGTIGDYPVPPRASEASPDGPAH